MGAQTFSILTLIASTRGTGPYAHTFQATTPARDLRAGGTMLQATRRVRRRSKGGADAEKSWVACCQSHGGELWDLALTRRGHVFLNLSSLLNEGIL